MNSTTPQDFPLATSTSLLRQWILILHIERSGADKPSTPFAWICTAHVAWVDARVRRTASCGSVTGRSIVAFACLSSRHVTLPIVDFASVICQRSQMGRPVNMLVRFPLSATVLDCPCAPDYGPSGWGRLFAPRNPPVSASIVLRR